MKICGTVVRPLARSVIFTRKSRSRDTSISVKATFFFFRRAFASMQYGQ